MLPMDFDPYDLLCRIQEEQAQLRKSQDQILRNQRELAAAYNKLKDDWENMAKVVNEIKLKHNTLVNKHQHLEIKLNK
jgi:hypothetical protein